MNFTDTFKTLTMPMDRWLFGAALVLVLMPPFGSLGSIIILVMSIAAWKIWISDMPRFRPTRIEKWMIAIVCFYFFSSLFFSAIKAKEFSHLNLVWNNLGLLIGLALLPVLRVKAKPNWLEKIGVSVAISGIVLGVATLAAQLFGTYDKMLFSGNALILAYLAGVIAVFGLIFFFYGKINSWLSLLGATGALFALLMTGRRGPTLAVFIVYLPIFAIAARHHFRKIILLLLCVVLAGGTAVAVSNQSPAELLRINELIARLENPQSTAVGEKSLRFRGLMYRDGWEAFKQSPFIGHGRKNAYRFAAQKIARPDVESDLVERYSHLHNALLTDAVTSGIFGIIGMLGMYLLPILACWRGSATVRLLGFSFAGFFFLYSLTNLGFYHDVMVFSYIFFLALLNGLAATSDQANI